MHNKTLGCVLRASVDHVKELVRQHGTDCWWSLDREKLLPRHVLEQVLLHAILHDDLGRFVHFNSS